MELQYLVHRSSQLRWPGYFCAVVLVVVAVLGAQMSSAATIVWSGASGADIDTGANWVGGVVPSVTNADTAQWNGTVAGALSLTHGGTVYAGGPGNAGINFDITAAQTGSLTIDSAANTSSIRLNAIGIASGAGAFTLGNGANTFNMTFGGTGGTHSWTNNSANAATISSDVAFGLGNAGAHTLTLSGTGDWVFNTGALQASGTLTVQKSGSGKATFTGANNYSGSTIIRQGTLTLSGGAKTGGGGYYFVDNSAASSFSVIVNISANITALQLWLGDRAGASPLQMGAVYQTAGAVSLTQAAGIDNLRIGSVTGGQGYYKLSGGSLAVNEAGIGASLSGTVGVMDIIGGAFNVAGYITVGRGGTTSSGLMNLTGGSATATRIHLNYAGTSGAISVLNVSNATVTLAGSTSLGLDLANSATAGTVGVANLLNGGTLTAGTVTASQGAPTAHLNFNGGTLKAATTNAGSGFLTNANVDGVYVFANGGTLDNNGTAITVSRPLTGATGTGVSSITGPGAQGSGYAGAPLVTITGGAGSVATAYAVMADDGSGNGTFKVASIIVSCPGIYTVAPTTVTLTGGGTASTASGFTLNTAANTSGAMNFSGAGTNTLTSANTYAGNTVVQAGTLVLGTGGSLTSLNIVVSNGATFDVSALSYTLSGAQSLSGFGTVRGVVNTSSGSKVFAGTDGTYGTNTFTTNLTFAAGATVHFDLGTSATGVNDRINVGGNLTFNSTVLRLKAPSAAVGLDVATDYVLFYLDGAVSGTPTITWDVAPTNSADYSIVASGNTVRLHNNAANTPPAVNSFAVNPTTVGRNDLVTFIVNASAGSLPLNAVTVDASLIGGSAAVPLNSAGGGNYTNTITVSAATTPGTKILTATAADTGTGTASTTAPLTVAIAARTWDGGSPANNNWTSNPNWLTDAAPGTSGDSVIFAGTTRLTPSLDASYGVTSVAFDSTAGSFSVGAGGGTLTNSGGVTNNSPNAQAWNAPMILSVPQTFNAAAGSLAFGSTIANGGNLLMVLGDADTTVGGAISGTGDLAKLGNGALTFTGASTYNGVTTVNGGSLNLNAGGSITEGTASIVNVASAAGNATLAISGGTLNANKNSAPSLQAGTSAGANGVITLNSGTLSLANELWLGSVSGGYGAFTINGGTVTVGSWLALARGGGTGLLNVNGGALTISANNLTIGSLTSGNGVATFAGGTTTVAGGGVYAGENVPGVLTVSGNAALNLNGALGLKLANAISASGVVNLNGGTTTTPIIQRGSGVGTLNFNGGTLKPTAASTGFLTNLSAAYIYEGGAVIDDNGFAITVGQPLLAPTGFGVSSVPVLFGGGGYVGAPMVTISGGTGSGATAIAQISGDTITNILITCPGSGYASGETLTVTLTGGGATADATFGTPGLAALTGGGLTKQGGGTLILGGANTYPGATVVKTGTLALGAGGSIAGSSITVSNGATFNVSAVSFTLGGGQSLLGRGVNSGSVTAASGSAIYAGTDGTYGTNTFASNLTLAAGAAGFLDVGTSASGSNDRLNVSGNLIANNNQLRLKAPSTSAGLATNADYILFSVTGTIGGSFLSTPAWDVAPTNAGSFIIVTDAGAKQVRLSYTTNTPPTGIGSATPASALHYQNVTLYVMATPGSSPISSVTVNLSPLGGAASQVMINTGTGTNFAWALTIGASASVGNYSLAATMVDSIGLSGLASIPLTIIAANEVWDGGGADDNWGTAANWVGDVPPGSGDLLTFAGTTRLTPQLEANYSVPALTFDATAGSFTLGSAASTLTLTGGVTNNSANPQMLDVPIALAGTVKFNTAAGSITAAKIISGTGQLQKSGGGALALLAANTYSGDTTVSGGTLRVTSGGQLYSGAANNTATITVGAGAVLELATWFNGSGQSLGNLGFGAGQIVVDGGAIRVTGVTGYGRGVTVNAGGATFEAAAGADWFLHTFTDSSAFNYSGNPTLIFTGAGAGRFDKVFSGSGAVIKRGPGKWTLGAVNTYTGSTIVEQGVLRIFKPSFNDAATVSVAKGAIMDLGFWDNDKIGALILGGTNMPNGTYSKTTHPNFFIGPGRLVVGGPEVTNTPPMTWVYGGGGDAGIQATITASMNGAVGYYNDGGYLQKAETAVYNSGVPTAQAGYSGYIEFGGSRNLRTAIHEITHTLGAGTISGFSANLVSGVWVGTNGNRLIQQIDGPTATIHGDGVHYWPYELNYDSEFSDRNAKVTVRIIEALRRDMGILSAPPTISAIADRSIAVNGTTGVIPFTISSSGTAVTGHSSNTSLVPANNIVFGGSGTARNVTVTPLAGQSGTTAITVTVVNGTDATSTAFTLNVTNSIATNPTNISYALGSGNLTLSWPSDHTGWRLLVQTNNLVNGLSVNPNDWAAVPNSQQTNQVTLPVDAALPMQFYRLIYP